MKVYKVVHKSRKDGKLESAVAVIPLAYAMRRRTTPAPECGPLCAFDSLAEAKRFFRSYGDEIWECLAAKSKLVYVWRPGRLTFCNVLPSGTILCDAITLTKKVWPPEEKG